MGRSMWSHAFMIELSRLVEGLGPVSAFIARGAQVPTRPGFGVSGFRAAALRFTNHLDAQP